MCMDVAQDIRVMASAIGDIPAWHRGHHLLELLRPAFFYPKGDRIWEVVLELVLGGRKLGIALDVLEIALKAEPLCRSAGACRGAICQCGPDPDHADTEGDQCDAWDPDQWGSGSQDPQQNDRQDQATGRRDHSRNLVLKPAIGGSPGEITRAHRFVP